MKMKIYSVYDSKAKAFITPFFMVNDDMAIRIFTECANDPNHTFGRFASDVSLFRIGEFDDATGELEPVEKYVNLGLASSFKKESEK